MTSPPPKGMLGILEYQSRDQSKLTTEVNDIKKQLEEFTFLDKSLLEKDLICNICSRYLNVSPIVYNDNIGNICGRCSSGSTLNGLGAILRQQVYEDLVKNLTFPCANKNYGCVEVLRFDDVQAHERGCRFQCTSCPLFCKQLFPDKTCSWTGNTTLLGDHLKTHQDNFLDPPQFDWPQDEKNMIFFTNVGNQAVTVVIKHESASKYVCLVMVNGNDLESQCFRYQLELSDEDKSNSLILRRNRLEPLSDFLDVLRCPEKTLEVDIDKISQMLQNPKKVCAKFGIVKKNKKEIIQITGVKDGDVLSGGSGAITFSKEKNAPPDEEMLIELECPVCNEFMIPPIHICATGHSVCSECKCKVQNCPTCRSLFADGRNFTLEKLTLKVKYPCKNREIGCGFVTTSDKIKQHQNSCELSENPCILKCGWKGLGPGLYNHFLDKHSAQLVQHNTAILMNSRQDKNTTNYFLYVMGELFCLSFKNCSKFTVKYNVMHVRYAGTEPTYKYSMQFAMSPDSQCPNLTMTNFCQQWNDNLAEALVGVGAVTVPGDLLKAYVFQNHLYYIKINITKV